MNTYKIPRGEKSNEEYFDYCSSLPLVFIDPDSKFISVNPGDETVQLEGTITGYTPLSEGA